MLLRFLAVWLLLFFLSSCGGGSGGNTEYQYTGRFLASYVKGLKVCPEGGSCVYTDSSGNFVVRTKVKNPELYFYKDNLKIGQYRLSSNGETITPFSLSKDYGDEIAKLLHGFVGDINGTASTVDLTKVKITSATSTDLISSLSKGETVEINYNYNGTPLSLKVSNDNVTLCSDGNCGEVNYRSWLFLIYMAADNSLNSYADEDINEILQVPLSPQVKVVILRDSIGNSGGVIYDYDYSTFSFSQKTIEEPNMGDPKTLENFVETYFHKYPASKVALVMWNHGDGWRGLTPNSFSRGSAEDSTDNDLLTMHEMKEALDYLKNKEINFSFIGFDECLMGSLEVFYDIKDYTEAVAASELEELGPGWNYSYVLEALNDNPGMTGYELAKAVVDAYRREYSNTGNYTMVAISREEIESLVGYLNGVTTLLSSDTYDCFNSAVNNLLPIEYSLSSVDLYQFLLELSSCLSSTYVEGGLNLMENLYKYTSNTDYQGVSIFLPQDNLILDEYSYYLANCTSPVSFSYDPSYCNPFTETSWDEFIKEYLSF